MITQLKPSLENSPEEAVKASIEYTISQDFAAGHSAEQGRRLRDFHGEGNSNKSTSGQQQEQYLRAQQQAQQQQQQQQQQQAQRKILAQQQLAQQQQAQERVLAQQLQAYIQAQTQAEAQQQQHEQPAPSSQFQRRTPGNEQLRDSQRERIPLEQQTRKAVLMARQEEVESEKLAGPRTETLRLSRKRRKLTATANDIEENLASISAQPGQVANGLGQASNYEALSCHFRILYKVDCTGDYQHPYHGVQLFEDAPIANRSSNGCKKKRNKRQGSTSVGEIHIEGQAPVYDLEEYIEKNPDLAFIVLRRYQCPGGTRIRDEEIYVLSSSLRYALHAVARCYVSKLSENLRTLGIPPPLFEQQILQDPYLFIYHHRVPLQLHISENPDASMHVKSLLAYTSNMYGDRYREVDRLLREQLMTREHELALYIPNAIVVEIDRDLGEPIAYAVRKWAVYAEGGYVALDCWHWQTDGLGLARKQRRFMISRIPENKQCEIAKLTLIPLRFTDPDVSLKLALRGQKHWDLRNQSYVSYKGWNKSKDQFYPDSRFMIDHRTFHKMHPNSEAFRFDKPPDRLPFDPRPSRLSLETIGSQDLHLLLSPDTYGFYFTEKKWINILIDNIRPVTWNKTAFDRLVLPPQTKELIRALVTVRTSQRGAKHGLGLAGKREDIIAGKGNGLIMLLHGGPGTGKSLTAESVAEIAEMPLYRVTCGDVGTSADMVERYLNNVLTLGKEWNCILLLDEADVFLEERSMSDLKRNSLVSVFLRVLEYYDGILMLTSNRVGTFDEAFKSRIQVALYYKALTRPSRKKIWQNFLEMLEEDEEDVDLDELRNRLDELAGHELNGRQIRNTLTTARQLAIYKKEQLEWGHLEYALSLSTEFNDYIKRVQGHTDAQWATEEGIRA